MVLAQALPDTERRPIQVVQYCLYNREHRLWHKPNFQGYTEDVHQAGLFTMSDIIPRVMDVIPAGKNVAVVAQRALQFGTEAIWGPSARARD